MDKKGQYRIILRKMQARIRALTNLVRSAKYVAFPRVGLRVFSTETAPAQDVYEHVSNMKPKDLFQFEPFNNEDIMVSRNLGSILTSRTSLR